MYNLENKKIGVFGLGVTGESIYSEIIKQTSNIVCWDDSTKNRSLFTEQDNLLNITDNKWKSLDIIFISPGIPNNHQIFLLARTSNILILSDIELFLYNNIDSKIIVITGTNGKSTTTALIGHILNNSGFDFPIGGNIGLPVLSLPKHKVGYILELSSFQLDLIKYIDPTISVLLNITPDHLDRHGTFEKYCEAKKKAIQGDGIKIISTDNEITFGIYNKLIKNGEKKAIAISTCKNKNTVSCTTESLNDDFYDASTYNLPALPNLPGIHNQENIAASYTVCRSLGMKPQEIIEQLKSFKGLKHRMQNVGSKDNITYYNDSKATNANSASSSISSIKNIFWLAGGIFKEKNLNPLKKSLSNVRKAYLFGENKLLFSEYLKNKVDFEMFDTMQEAFAQAYVDAKQSKEVLNILLAPACASFDQFKNFEDRGNQFIDLCNEKLQ